MHVVASLTVPNLVQTAGHKLATCMWACNDVPGAESLLLATFERRLRLLGDAHEDTLHSMASLGQMRHTQMRIGEATTLLENALAGQMRLLGDRHPHTMQTMIAISNLNSLSGMTDSQDGDTFQRQKDRLALSERVYRVLRETKGALHMQTLAAAQGWLGVALGRRELTEVERADMEGQLQQAMAEAKEALGATHRIHVGLASFLRSSMFMRGSLDQASEFMRTLQLDMQQEVQQLERTWGTTHLRTRQALRAHADCCRDSGDGAAQVDLLQQLVDRTVAAVGELESETFDAKQQLAVALVGVGKADKASQVYQVLLSQQERSLGPLDNATLQTHKAYAHTLLSVDPVRAVPVFRAALASAKRAATNLSSGDPGSKAAAQVFASIQIALPLGGVLLSLKRYREAVQLLEEELDETTRVVQALEADTSNPTMLAMLKPMVAGLPPMLAGAKAALAASNG